MNTSKIDDSTPLVFRHGIPPDVPDIRRPCQKQIAVYLILISTLLERVAFHTVAANLVVNLESDKLLQWKPRHSSVAAFVFSGTSNISTLLSAVISDAKFGRAKTIIFGFFLYLTGYILAILIPNTSISICARDASYVNTTLNTNTVFQEPCAGWILGTLIIIAIGAGAVQSNMGVFGAEQIRQSKLTSRYFDKYMIAVNIGSIIATSAIPYIQTDPTSYFIGYSVAASMLLIAAIMFIIAYICRWYIHIKPNETVITKCIPVVINAFQSCYKYKKNRRSLVRERTNSFLRNLESGLHSLTEEPDETVSINQRLSTILEYAIPVNGGKFHDRIVDEVKSLRGALVVFILLIPYFLIYVQMDATFPLQGEHMKNPSGEKNIIPLMSLGDPVTIIIGILILNMFVYKYLDARHRSSTITVKFVIGMCFALITMCIAGIVENFRQDRCNLEKDESELSIYVQLIQNIFMGFSEIFAMTASYEYAYFAAPRSAQSLFMSVRFCSLGISSFIGSAYISGFPTTSFELNFSCRADEQMTWSFYIYFFILAGIQLVFIIIFIVCYKKYRIVEMNPEKTEKSQFVRQASTTSID